jgi:hypothetical protein
MQVTNKNFINTTDDLSKKKLSEPVVKTEGNDKKPADIGKVTLAEDKVTFSKESQVSRTRGSGGGGITAPPK